MKQCNSPIKLLILLLSISATTFGQYTGSNPDVAFSKPVLATDTLAGFEPGKAVDGLLITYGSIPGAAPAWVQIDLVDYYYINGYGMILPNPGELPRGYTFQVSVDASSWTNLDTRTISSQGTYGFNITSPDPIRYVRIYMTTKDANASFSEIFVYGFKEVPPAPPVARAANKYSASGFTARWYGSAGADGYVLSVATDAGFTNHVPGYDNLEASGNLFWAVSGLDPGTKYYYRVRAYNVTGTSSFGNVISATTLPLAQTIAFDSLAASTYGDNDFELTATASSGLPISYTSSDETVATVTGSTITIGGTGTSVITAIQNGNVQYLAATPVMRDLMVMKKALLVTGALAENKVYDGTVDAVISGAVLTGVVGTDDVSLEGDTVGLFAQSAVGSAIGVSTSMILSGSDTVHYTFTQPSGLIADITVKELTITGAFAENKVYDGTTDAVVSGATLNEVVGVDDVSLSDAETGIFAQAGVGTGIIVTNSMTIAGADVANYSFSAPTGLMADITSKELMVTAVDKSREACAPNPEFTVIYDGFVGTEDAGDLDSEPGATCSADAGSAAGTYDITVSGGSSANYFLTYVSGILTVTPDVTSPSLTVKNITIQLDEGGQATITPGDVVADASDNCSISEITLSKSSFSVSDIGDAYVEVTATDGSGNSTSKVSVVTVEGSTGMVNPQGTKVRFFPNPTEGLVKLEANRVADEMKVMDMTGKTIISKINLGKEDTFDLSGYPGGLYIIQLRFGADTMHFRVVKK